MCEQKRELHLLSEAVENYLDFLEVTPFRLEEMQAIKTDFLRQMEMGLEGKHESLKMIATQLGELDKEALKEGEQALVIDAGGTGLKIGVCEVKNGEIVLVREEKEIIFPKTHWQADEFFDYIAEQIKEQKIDIKKINGIGFIFSFPAEAEKTVKGVDVKTEDKLTKDWQINGLAQKGFVGEQLIQALKKQFSDETETLEKLPLAVMNDTPATLYAEDKAVVGGVVGTGFNLAAMIDGMVRNIEAGGFCSGSLKLCQLAHIFDQTTDNSGRQLAEKQISGLGIGGQLREFVRLMVKQGVIRSELYEGIKKLDSRLASHIIDPSQEDYYVWQLLQGKRKLLDFEGDLLKPVCERLLLRSTQILASFLAAVGEKVGQDELVIPIDGSFFWKTPGYKEMLIKQLELIDPQRKYNFVGEGKRLGFIGAAKVALSIGSRQI